MHCDATSGSSCPRQRARLRRAAALFEAGNVLGRDDLVALQLEPAFLAQPPINQRDPVGTLDHALADPQHRPVGRDRAAEMVDTATEILGHRPRIAASPHAVSPTSLHTRLDDAAVLLAPAPNPAAPLPPPLRPPPPSSH